jgi:hypothetical protein
VEGNSLVYLKVLSQHSDAGRELRKNGQPMPGLIIETGTSSVQSVLISQM